MTPASQAAGAGPEALPIGYFAVSPMLPSLTDIASIHYRRAHTRRIP